MSRRAQSVLVIDDSQDIHDLIDVRLSGDHIHLLHALDAESGLALARETTPDLVLLDLDLPGTNGLDVCRELRAVPELAPVPIIFLTGTVDVVMKVKAFEVGAVDYVTKPFDGVELRARVGAALRTKRYLDLLATRAQLDGLTGLWNRAYLDARLADDVAAATRYQRDLALLIVDIDRFKSLNDNFGHAFGDLALRRVGELLTLDLRPGDVACRYGGDEFGVILREAGAKAAELTAERIRRAVAALELAHGGRRVAVQASIGFAAAERMSDPRDFSAAQLFSIADAGLMAAKRQGRNRVVDGHTASLPRLDDDADGGRAMVDETHPRAYAAGARVGHYEVVEPIGTGSMGTVYRAFDTLKLREVALKVLRPLAFRSEAWRRFAQEAHVLGALDHPNIVRVYDYGRSDDGSHFLALELLAGRTVRERLFEGPLAARDAIDLALELVRALVAAHEKRIVHRDLKPENLFLVAGGGLKVLDFGLAKVSTSIGQDQAITMAATAAGVLLGTAGYLAPEQARGQAVDARGDLFSVGAILYELVTGRRAFLGDSAVETMHAVITQQPVPIGDDGFDRLLARCLAKDPAQRIATARELEAELTTLRARLGERTRD